MSKPIDQEEARLIRTERRAFNEGVSAGAHHVRGLAAQLFVEGKDDEKARRLRSIAEEIERLKVS